MFNVNFDEFCRNISNEGDVSDDDLTSDFKQEYNNMRFGRINFSILHLASARGRPLLLQLTIIRRGDVNAITNYDSTPLHYACLYGHEDCVDILLNNMADIYRTNKVGQTCLDLARMKNYHSIIEKIEAHQERTLNQIGAAASSFPLCSICMDKRTNMALNCGHTFCEICASRMDECLNCRKKITQRLKIFL